MSESFSLIINSQNSASIYASGSSATNPTVTSYYVNWSAVIPYQGIDTPKQSYKLSFTLKSISGTTALSQNAFIDVNFGQSNMFIQTNNQPTTRIGFIYPVVVQQSSVLWNYFFTCTPYDNVPVCISYPSNSIITVQFSDFKDGTVFAMQPYVLVLNFEPIKE